MCNVVFIHFAIPQLQSIFCISLSDIFRFSAQEVSYSCLLHLRDFLSIFQA